MHKRAEEKSQLGISAPLPACGGPTSMPVKPARAAASSLVSMEWPADPCPRDMVGIQALNRDILRNGAGQQLTRGEPARGKARRLLLFK